MTVSRGSARRGGLAHAVAVGVAVGAAAGAAGTTVLNGVTYLDMALRGRPTSNAPQDTVEALAAKAGIDIPGDKDTRMNRTAGRGPLLGLLAGLSVGAVLGAARALGFRPNLAITAALSGGAAMAATDGPMAALGVSDPTTWAAKDWLADAVPHAAYGIATAAVLARLEQRGHGNWPTAPCRSSHHYCARSTATALRRSQIYSDKNPSPGGAWSTGAAALSAPTQVFAESFHDLVDHGLFPRQRRPL